MGFLRQRSDLLPSFVILVSAAFWGLFWLPVRQVESQGVSAAWTSALIFASCVVVFLPLILWRRRLFAAGTRDMLIAGCLAGVAFSFYAISFNLTEVVRALLLFYMTPVWSTLLGILVLGEKPRLNRVLALVLGLGGLLVILGTGVQFPWPRNLGDWLALLSGLTWSFASVRLFRGGAVLVLEKTFLFVVFAALTSVILAVLPIGIPNDFPTAAVLAQIWPWLAAVALVMLPLSIMTIWPTALLSPARVGILFMAEIVVGVSSAAVLTDEPFGWREISGALLILAAGLVEVLPMASRRETRKVAVKPEP